MSLPSHVSECSLLLSSMILIHAVQLNNLHKNASNMEQKFCSRWSYFLLERVLGTCVYMGNNTDAFVVASDRRAAQLHPVPQCPAALRTGAADSGGDWLLWTGRSDRQREHASQQPQCESGTWAKGNIQPWVFMICSAMWFGLYRMNFNRIIKALLMRVFTKAFIVKSKSILKCTWCVDCYKKNIWN